MEQKKGNQVMRTNKKKDICLSVIFSRYDPRLFTGWETGYYASFLRSFNH